jgi:hypothetical protein
MKKSSMMSYLKLRCLGSVDDEAIKICRSLNVWSVGTSKGALNEEVVDDVVAEVAMSGVGR